MARVIGFSSALFVAYIAAAQVLWAAATIDMTPTAGNLTRVYSHQYSRAIAGTNGFPDPNPFLTNIAIDTPGGSEAFYQVIGGNGAQGSLRYNLAFNQIPGNPGAYLERLIVQYHTHDFGDGNVVGTWDSNL